MKVATYPADLSPYPSERFLSARRVDPRDYPKWDGVCLKVGPVGLSLSWPRR